MTLIASKLRFGQIAPNGGPVVKMCGLMSADHAITAVACGATMLGLIFARSRRMVTVETARAIVQAVDAFEKRPFVVGVFVNELPQEVLAIAERVGLDIVQLSGDETPMEVAECAVRYPVLKALRFPAGTPVAAALDDFSRYRAHVLPGRLRFLVDTYHEGAYGGTGKLADWGIASELARREKIMLAGGLTPDNVASAVRQVGPWGVDVSSGIEREGVKDAELIESFVRNARQ